MKNINVYHWKGTISELQDYYPHNSVFDGVLVEVVADIINRGYEVMTKHINQNEVVLYVNNFGVSFKQS